MGATSRLPTPLCEFPFINFHVSFFGRRRGCVVFQVHALSVVFLAGSLDEQAVSQKCNVTAFMIIAFGISSRGPLPEVAEVGSPSPGSGHPSVPAVGMFLLREEPGVRFAQRSAQGWAVWGEDDIRCAASCPLVTLSPCWPDVVSLWPLDLGSPHEASVCVPMHQLAQRLAARHGARPGGSRTPAWRWRNSRLAAVHHPRGDPPPPGWPSLRPGVSCGLLRPLRDFSVVVRVPPNVPGRTLTDAVAEVLFQKVCGQLQHDV